VVYFRIQLKFRPEAEKWLLIVATCCAYFAIPGRNGKREKEERRRRVAEKARRRGKRAKTKRGRGEAKTVSC